MNLKISYGIVIATVLFMMIAHAVNYPFIPKADIDMQGFDILDCNSITTNMSYNNITDWPPCASTGYAITCLGDTITTTNFNIDGKNWKDDFDAMGNNLDNATDVTATDTITGGTLTDGTMSCTGGDCTGIDDINATKAYVGDATNYVEIKSDGEINLYGTARIKKTSWIDAGGLKAPGSKPATFVESGIAGSWEFSDANSGSEESVSGVWKIPTDMDKTEAPTMKLNWYANGVSPGDCAWQLEYLWIELGEDETSAAQETISINSTASSTSNGMINAEFTGIDLPASSDSGLFFRITRMSASPGDTISAAVLLRGRAIVYYSDKLGQAI